MSAEIQGRHIRTAHWRLDSLLPHAAENQATCAVSRYRPGPVVRDLPLSSNSPPIPMLPSIALANSVEMLRDGGSLCASFQGANGSRYWLVLPVRMSDDHSRLGYADPVIVERPFAPEELTVSWRHAEILLRQIERLLPPTAERDWVEPMYECIRAQGDWLPPSYR